MFMFLHLRYKSALCTHAIWRYAQTINKHQSMSVFNVLKFKSTWYTSITSHAPSASTSLIMSCSSCSDGFMWSWRMTRPSSLIVIDPLSSASNSRNAFLKSERVRTREQIICTSLTSSLLFYSMLYAGKWRNCKTVANQVTFVYIVLKRDTHACRLNIFN